MAIHSTDAIVLRRYLYRETSVIVSCLTERFGKVKGLVKGLRQTPSRHRSAMEPMTVNHIVFYDTHESQIHLISQCELRMPLAGLQQDLDITRCAAFCVDLTDAVMPLEEPQPAIYHLLRHTLERLATGPAALDRVRVHYVLRLLRLIGFQPQLDRCTGCSVELSGEAHWSAKQGGLLCPACLHTDIRAERMRAEIIEALGTFATADEPAELQDQWLPVLRRRLDDFLRWRLDHPLKTMSHA